MIGSIVSREAFVIARRELLERVRSKWFLIGTILGPIAMLAVILVPALLAAKDDKAVKIALVIAQPASPAAPTPAQTSPAPADIAAPAPAGSTLADELIAGFALLRWQAHLSKVSDEAVLLEQVRKQQINGFLVVPADILDAGTVTYQGDNGTSTLAMARLEAVVTSVVQRRRGLAAGVTDTQILRMLAKVDLRTKHTTGEAAGASGTATFVVGYVVMFLLYIAILLYASNVMRSVVQEKTSRVVELMVAAVKPRALMAGKVLGVGAVGLVQLAVWLGMGVLTITYRDALLGLVGIAGTGGLAIPPLTAAQVGVILLYFVLGYFLYAALYAAVGAMVSSEQEAQQAQMPVMTLIIIAVACVQLVANDPRGGAASALTTIPFFSPLLMPMRFLLGGASAVDVLVSVAVLLVTLVVVVIAAGRIYRVGVLMVGKRPTMRELWRWVRY